MKEIRQKLERIGKEGGKGVDETEGTPSLDSSKGLSDELDTQLYKNSILKATGTQRPTRDKWRRYTVTTKTGS